ncbi:LAMI_0D01684g1_1 [Lachancea mirantina]|uniref:LAMI_0D01684g1_1 n=1 Tax=Lachancea mirantina TaxID=1230905 RepID=A0A1G4J8R6_9SACH|nr:LAMI_0D01684g1_1 [Lachancea mirantina]
MTFKVPTVALRDTGDKIPVLGFGSGTKWRIAKTTGEREDQFIDELAQQVTDAIKAGFNHIDTAEVYKTHPEVGEGIKRAKVAREKLWITDKYHPHSYNWRKSSGPIDSLKYSLDLMELSYVDLYLLHLPTINKENAGLTLEDAWKQMEELRDLGLARNIGVSNFDVGSLARIHRICKYPPAVNQIEFNAYMQQQSPGIFNYCKQNNILVEGYSPLSPLTKGSPGPLDDVLPSLATKYERTPAQILLRWAIQRGIVVLTTSGRIERLQEYMGALSFELSAEDEAQITSIGRGKILHGFMHQLYGHQMDSLYDDL